nr:hypothetical protein [Natrinema altunense]
MTRSLSVSHFNVRTPSLADGDLTSAELRDRLDIIAFWRENEEERRLIKHAL